MGIFKGGNMNKIIQKNEEEIFQVLSNSLYVGAQSESIRMVLNYCKAAGLDPMLKPVHIVPMYCSTGQKTKDGRDIKTTRDVIMPGIGLYRMQASRTEQLAGVSEPEYGAVITEKLGSVEVTYPEWCKITVRRITKTGYVAEFTAKEFWKENYATKSRDDKAPNAMWQKRPYGQLSKCAESQALRKAFHELGAQPTAEEMEGKEIDITPSNIDHITSGNVVEIEYISADQATVIRDLCKESKSKEEAFCSFLAVESIEKIPADMYKSATEKLDAKIAKLAAQSEK